MRQKLAIVAITKHGIQIARTIKEKMPEFHIYVPLKYKDNDINDITWFSEQTSRKVEEVFKNYDTMICIFSLGAVIRLISPFLVDKKTDPAVLVIDDKAKFVISTLSGHLGGANYMTKIVAKILNSTPVITTAADVNETIAVDLVGKEFGWDIDNYENVTKVSAFMVNEEKIALYQQTGEKSWWDAPSLPKNVIIVNRLDEITDSQFKGALVITDIRVSDKTIREKSVIYCPKSLVVGVGLHWDTATEAIESGIKKVFEDNKLNFKSIRNIASINREGQAKVLRKFCNDHNIPLQLYNKEELATVPVPNPSDAVQKFEGTASVSEAASILSSGGEIIISKQKFPPNLTIAVSRVKF